MASGIEHREAESVIEAYADYDKPNFAIFAGKQLRVKYEGGNLDEGMQVLTGFLNQIQRVNTASVYTLRVYDEHAKVTSATPYEGSTTFMISPAVPVTKNENGVTIIDRGVGATNYGAGMAGFQALQQTMTEMMKQNQDMMQMFMQRQQEDKMDKLIAAIQEKADKEPPPKQWWENIGELVVQNPTIIDRIGFIFRPEIYQVAAPGTPPISGTTQTQSQTQTEPMAELTEAQITALEDRMDAALDKLEDSLGIEKITMALEKLAAMDTMKLKALLMMM